MISPMSRLAVLIACLGLALAVACSSPEPDAASAAAPAESSASPAAASSGPLALPEERHLTNVRQLTFGGENAEAYFSFDGEWLSFQSTGEFPCDQIYTMRVDGSERQLVSSGQGRTTCSHYTPDGQHIVYASTHLAGEACPPVPGRERGYVWPIYDSYDIFRADRDGSNIVRLTDTPGYDAEATIGPDGTIVFTSVRDGDMEIYTMNPDGSDVRRLTNLPGPDGGPFFSPDGSKIVFRGQHPEPGAELDEYFGLLKQGLWRPTTLDVFVMDRDGSNLRRVTTQAMEGANWAPYFTPDGNRIIFASNFADPAGRDFDIYLIDLDGASLEQVTFYESFDGFPMFSPDGTRLVFSSNRNAAQDGETNVFIADWVW
jgi:Tol biopolymer transport system component